MFSKSQADAVTRVLAELCFSKLSYDINEIELHDYGSSSRVERYMKSCIHILGAQEISADDFIHKLVTLDYSESLNLVAGLSDASKDKIADYILYIMGSDILPFGTFLFANDLRIVDDIVSRANIRNTHLRTVIEYSRRINYKDM